MSLCCLTQDNCLQAMFQKRRWGELAQIQEDVWGRTVIWP